MIKIVTIIRQTWDNHLADDQQYCTVISTTQFLHRFTDTEVAHDVGIGTLHPSRQFNLPENTLPLPPSTEIRYIFLAQETNRATGSSARRSSTQVLVRRRQDEALRNLHWIQTRYIFSWRLRFTCRRRSIKFCSSTSPAPSTNRDLISSTDEQVHSNFFSTATLPLFPLLCWEAFTLKLPKGSGRAMKVVSK